MSEKDLPLFDGAENLNALDYGMINRALEFGKAKKTMVVQIDLPRL